MSINASTAGFNVVYFTAAPPLLPIISDHASKNLNPVHL